MIASLRQWLYPREFRIRDPGVSSGNLHLEEVINELENLVERLNRSRQTDTKFIEEIATSVWRLEKRMEGLSSDPELSKVKRALNMMKDVLKEQKIEIKDYTGKSWGPPYDEMSWDDVKGGPMQKGGTIRMVEPCILYDGRVIQKGKIIVEERRQI